MNRIKPIFILPVALYLVLVFLYMLVIPPGESPDEPSHLQCIEQVTEYGRIPLIVPKPGGKNWWDRERVISGMECYHMPLYYLQAGMLQRLVHQITQRPFHYEFPPINPAFPTSPTMFSRPVVKSLPNIGEPISLTALRLESITLGLFTLAATFIVTRQIVGKSSLAPVLSMTLAAGWPQFLFMSRAINNDVLATALSVASLALLFRFQHPRRFFWAIVLSGLAVLTKLTMLFSAIAILAALALEWASSPPGQRRRFFKPALMSLIILGCVVAVMLLHPTLRSHLEHNQASINYINPKASTVQYWLDVLDLSIKSSWGLFGWMNVPAPAWQAYLWWIFLASTIAIAIASAVFRRERGVSTRPTVVGLIWLTSFLVSYIRINLNRFQPQFRFILPVIPVTAALAAVGLFTLLDHWPRLQRWVTLSLIILLLLVNLWIVFGILSPTYGGLDLLFLRPNGT